MMEFNIKKVGIIKDSSVKLDGLTIITGVNNSGKSTVGKALYERMNRSGDELDMISFKSAVKVGAVQKGVDVTTSKDVTNALSILDDSINNTSDKHLDYTTGEVIEGKPTGNSVAVTVQDLSNLRMQQNTEAH